MAKKKTSVKRASKANDSGLVPLREVMPAKRTATKGKRASHAAKPTMKAEPKPKKLSLLDAAAQVLKAKGEPMRCKEIVATVVEKGLWKTDAPTPEATLYSGILREMKKGADSRFKKTDRGLFAFNGRRHTHFPPTSASSAGVLLVGCAESPTRFAFFPVNFSHLCATTSQ